MEVNKMQDTIDKLVKEAEKKYGLAVLATLNHTRPVIYVSELKVSNWTSTHYPNNEKFFIGLIALVDTGYASLPVKES
jgi:hypothetical protein